MMDRFKFRAWRKNRNIMYHFDFDELSLGPVGHMGYLTNNKYNDSEVYVYDDQLILMQSTGRKDKNGKLIYGCDIMKWQSTTDPKPRFSEVKFYEYEDGEGYGEDNHLGWRCFETLPDMIARGGIVVGNVHENPELLEMLVTGE